MPPRKISRTRDDHEVLLFMPRGRAHRLRRRMASAPDFRNVTVSHVYRTGKAWAVTLSAPSRAKSA